MDAAPPAIDPEQARVLAAVELAREGKVAEAELQLRDLIAANPLLSRAHLNLGVALSEQGKSEEALACIRQALKLAPGYFEAQLNLAMVLADLQRVDEAIEHYRQVLSERPDSADALNGLGMSLLTKRRPAEALVYIQQATRLRHDFVEAHNSTGLAFSDLGDFSNAEAAYHRALQLRPLYVEAHVNLASCYAQQSKFPAALAQYDIALWLNPQHVSTHWNRSLALLQSGNYKEGWSEYEWRHRRAKSPMRPLEKPIWEGADLTGKTILVWAEQGLGDTLQFCRYIPLLKKHGARQIILECPLPLIKLLGHFPGVDQLVPAGAPLPFFDTHVALLSLPRLFETTLENVPPAPYLTADSDRVKHWRSQLAGLNELKVGLAWQGNPHHQFDRYRSMPLSVLSALQEVAGIRLYSLQRGPGSEQVGLHSQHLKLSSLLDSNLVDPTAWVDIAAIMMNLDVVISVDTATAHLAGALGVPTLLPLAACCDWRWLSDRADSPWYSSIKLFRQRELGKWNVIVQEMASELKRMVRAKEL